MTVFFTVLMVGVAVLWVLTPLSLFGVRTRLNEIETAWRHHTDEITGELRRLNAKLDADIGRIFPDKPKGDVTLLVRQGSRTNRA